MSHLTLEALARLLDEAPNEEERIHLGECATCRAELDGLQGQSDALASLPKMMPAPDGWAGVRDRLRQERVIARPELVPPGRRWTGPVRAAAALALFVGGGALGYGMRGLGPERPVPVAAPTELASGPAADPTAGSAAVRPGLREVEEAQDAFFAALDDYMAGTTVRASDPAARLATLENIVRTTAEALNESPADPVINSFHLTALAQRNAMLREIATTSSDPVF